MGPGVNIQAVRILAGSVTDEGGQFHSLPFALANNKANLNTDGCLL